MSITNYQTFSNSAQLEQGYSILDQTINSLSDILAQDQSLIHELIGLDANLIQKKQQIDAATEADSQIQDYINTDRKALNNRITKISRELETKKQQLTLAEDTAKDSESKLEAFRSRIEQLQRKEKLLRVSARIDQERQRLRDEKQQAKERIQQIFMQASNELESFFFSVENSLNQSISDIQQVNTDYQEKIDQIKRTCHSKAENSWQERATELSSVLNQFRSFISDTKFCLYNRDKKGFLNISQRKFIDDRKHRMEVHVSTNATRNDNAAQWRIRYIGNSKFNFINCLTGTKLYGTEGKSYDFDSDRTRILVWMANEEPGVCDQFEFKENDDGSNQIWNSNRGRPMYAASFRPVKKGAIYRVFAWKHGYTPKDCDWNLIPVDG